MWLFNFDNGSFLMKLKSRVVLDGPCDDDYDDLWASLSTVRWSKMKTCDRLNLDTLIIQYNAAIRKEGGPLSVMEKKEEKN